jgi:hypothetical protein
MVKAIVVMAQKVANRFILILLLGFFAGLRGEDDGLPQSGRSICHMKLYVRVFLNPRLGWAEVEVEKRISPLRCSQKREQLRSK